MKANDELRYGVEFILDTANICLCYWRALKGLKRLVCYSEIFDLSEITQKKFETFESSSKHMCSLVLITDDSCFLQHQIRCSLNLNFDTQTVNKCFKFKTHKRKCVIAWTLNFLFLKIVIFWPPRDNKFLNNKLK